MTTSITGSTSKAAFDLPDRDAADKARARRLQTALRRRYPDACCELDYSNPHELLVATILSAQSTDVGVNKAWAAAQHPSIPIPARSSRTSNTRERYFAKGASQPST